MKTEFIYETAPFPSCHASTLAETEAGLIAAWFGGSREGAPDVGIWVSRQENGGWTRPIEVADGATSSRTRVPCWNPVLFSPEERYLLLFYKAGLSPSQWLGLLKISEDQGKTWSEARLLPEGILGPIKNKPVLLADGSLLCPSSTEDRGWRIHFERTDARCRAWETTGPINDSPEIGAIQPSILSHGGLRLQAIGRTQQGKMFSVDTVDAGRTWSPMTLLDLPNPNSGTDAVTLQDGRFLLIYNHSSSARSPLNAAISSDGIAWKPLLTLENAAGEYSYPAVIQTHDGLVHITYTWQRTHIKHVVLNAALLKISEAASEEA